MILNQAQKPGKKSSTPQNGYSRLNLMEDNIWEYPFGDPEDDDDMFFNREQQSDTCTGDSRRAGTSKLSHFSARSRLR